MKCVSIAASLFILFITASSTLFAQSAWERIPPDPQVIGITGLGHIAVDASGRLWAFGPGLLFKSDDKGVTFVEHLDVQFQRPPGGVLSSVMTDGGMFVGSISDGVNALIDNYWSHYNSPGSWIRALTFTPAGTLIAGTSGGVYALGPVVIGEGYTWVQLLSSSDVFDLMVLPSGAILAASEDGIYRSDDDGQTWSLRYAPAPRAPVYGLARTSTGALFASGDYTCSFFSGTGQSEGGVYRSTDDGLTWSVASSGLTTPTGACIVPLSDIVATAQDEVIVAMEYAAVPTLGFPAGVFISTDDGGSWTAYNTGFQNSDVPRQFALSPDGTLYLYSHSSGQAAIYVRSGVSGTAREGDMPSEFTLAPAYPNPFNPSTTIAYAIDAAQHVRLSVFDALGRRIATLADGIQPAGRFELQFDAGNLPTGVYTYRMETDRGVQTRSMTLVR